MKNIYIDLYKLADEIRKELKPIGSSSSAKQKPSGLMGRNQTNTKGDN